MDSLYLDVCNCCSRLITKRYSTSFSLGIRVFNKKYRMPIYAIYGFVRFADEIVDTFHDKNKGELLSRFREETFRAIREGISLNPVLQSFQVVVNEYGIEDELITAFLDSMEMDLYNQVYDHDSLDRYIYGSAEVVGLMCLRVFCPDNEEYQRLKPFACSLGSAFQKINFLRDMKSDYEERGRTYFPEIDFHNFTNVDKERIETEIKEEFDHAYEGIKQLPKGVRFGVYLAYRYYTSLFQKIKGFSPKKITEERIRINNRRKIYLLGKCALRNSLNML